MNFQAVKGELEDSEAPENRQIIHDMGNNSVKSPLNYTGGKYRLLPQILPHFPEKVEGTFYDLFCGGGNVGANVNAGKVVFNDSDKYVIGLLRMLCSESPEHTIGEVDRISKLFGLSDSFRNGYEPYGVEGNKGLSTYNKDKFLELRKHLNSMDSDNDEEYWITLYTVVIYAFNTQIRFNAKGEYNLPVGKCDFNGNIRKNLEAFVRKVNGMNREFTNRDFREFGVLIQKNDFVYCDPPYLITCASYNEKGGWCEKDERDLLSFLDGVHANGAKFALSNVIESKGKANELLAQWIGSHPEYRTVHLDYGYGNCSYHTKDRSAKSDEVLVMNY